MALTKIDDRGLNTPIDLLDNEKIRFGTDEDLQIYHSGSHAFIANTQGQLNLRCNTTVHLSDDAGYDLLKGTKDGSVEVYYDGGKKLETTSTGVSISGELQVEDVEGTTLRLGNTAAAASDGDYLSGIDFHIKDNNDSTGAVCAAIRSHADQNHTATAKGTALTLHTTDDDTTTLDERIRITSSGFIGAGTASPNHMLQLHRSDSNNSYTQYTNSTTGSAVGDGVWLGMGGDEACYLWQNENNHMAFGTNNTERLRITAGGNVSITDGNLVVASGHGIDFSATANTGGSGATCDSELFDDYERGTWTPADGSSGALTLSVGSASYVKVGNLVFINFYVVYPTNSDSATAYITGLPFTPKASQNYSYLTGRISSLSNGVAVQVNAGSASCHIYVGDTAYTNSQLSGKYILVSGCYST